MSSRTSGTMDKAMNKLEAKVGDILLVTSTARRTLMEVTRVTKTQIICGCRKFWRRNGVPVGAGTWSSGRAKVATQEDMDSVQEEGSRKRLARELEDIDFYSLPLSKLEKIRAIIAK